MSNPIADDILMHYGMPRRSGRYPWGSGENPYQHTTDFLARLDELKAEGKTQKEIADIIGLTTGELRTQESLAKAERRKDLYYTAKGLQEKGYNPSEIARKMGFKNESSVRSLLNEATAERKSKAMKAAEYLKAAVDEKGMIDVGSGVDKELGLSREKMREALYILQREGYEVYGGGIPQITNKGQQTNMKVLCKPGTEHKEIYNFENVHTLNEYDKVMTAEGNTRPRFVYPESLNSKRLQIRYAEQGGEAKDGVIELRRGVEDISLGNSNYSQVRIMVDGTHYLKGMAVYSDNLPPGVDVVFNTNKHEGTPALGPKDNTVLKPINNDPENPFKSLIKDAQLGGQRYYDDPKGKFIDPDTGKRQSLSVINKRADEGDWDEWAKKLPSQFLSKQSLKLINQQLSLTKADTAAEFEEICNLTNPTVKKKLLETFASECDSAAVRLKAASLPRQRYQVLLPLTGIKDNEVYAPNYKDGETVALVRFPHEGIYQIPILKVNNKNREGKAMITPNAKDAVGVSKVVAEQLSGADFDGDTVMVIPTGGKIKINNKPPLSGLLTFDDKEQYGPNSTSKPYKRMGKDQTQIEMGIISNLITDMTLSGAPDSELERATKYSMTVIDAEKHNLDYRRCYEEQGIAALKRKYQGHIDENGHYREGAGTIISRAKSQADVPKRKGSGYVNSKENSSAFHPYDPTRPEGAMIYKTDTDRLYYTDKNGKEKMRTQKSTKMAETDDAYTLISKSNNIKERAYADYANYMKAMANNARKEMLATERLKVNPSAKKTYAQEVNELEASLNESIKNRPKERQAERIANINFNAKLEADPSLKTDKSMQKKVKQITLNQAREKVGAKRHTIEITDRQWEAIQSGAVSENKLLDILTYADIDKVRERATPKSAKTNLSSAQISRIAAMANIGYTNQEIANKLGISTSTVVKYLKK